MLCVKPLPPSRVVEICCEVVLFISILVIGCTTASIWHWMTVPNKRFQIDIVDEIRYTARVLNVGLPAAILTLAASTAVKISRKRFDLLSFLLAAAGVAGVSACALAMYSCFVAAHPGVNLWSQIWWRSTP